VEAVALAAGHGADFFLLIGAGEAKAGNVGPHVGGDVAKLERVLAVGNRLPDHVIGI
jgi:hypothetical protein